MMRMLIAAAILCCLALAADNAAVAPQPVVNPQSGIPNLESVDAVTIPRLLSYQGKLTDTLGVPVPNGNYSVAFRLYTVPSGGSAFWNETQSVQTRDGLFAVLLGAVTPIASLPDAGALYLGMAVGGGAELTPRLRIASAAYAYLTERAANADLLQGKDTTALDSRFVNEAQANSVTSAMITDGNVTSADIRDTTVNTADIKDAAVTAPKLNQMGATSGQVMKWTGSAWAPRNDSVGGGGTLPDSVPGSFAVSTDLRVYGKGRIGLGNSNAGNAAFVAGEGNVASANYSSVSGGADNSASGTYSHIGGGGENRASGTYSQVGGGASNYASGGRSTVAGGSDNEAYGLYAAIGGGLVNLAGDAVADTAATVAGGYANVATGKFATVGGGRSNVASGNWATVSGGDGDTASGVHSTVGGGRSNDATGDYATVGGGDGNAAETTYATVGGGQHNFATGYGATVGGGYFNHAESANATVGGGKQNDATDTYATIGGGWGNRANGYAATVGGGYSNYAETSFATVGGGRSNYATGYAATVGGGYLNLATGSLASVLGGTFCLASGNRSFAAGSYAKAHGAGSFVWSDFCTNSDDSVGTTTDNRWVARARGGVYFYTDLDKSTGSYLSAGGSSWNSVSDSMTKENFRAVDKQALLEAVARMRVRNYNLKSQDESIRHIGPVAQDFHAAFGVGENNTSINLADADGIALAAIQALYEQNQMLSGRIDAQQAEIEALTSELKRR